MLDLGILQALVLDIDGTLWEGDHACPGAVQLVRHLNRHQTPYALLSNNTTRLKREYATRLTKLGMLVPQEVIITAAQVVTWTLVKEAEPGARCLVIGEAGLLEAISEAGFEVTQTDHRGVRYVVIGMDRQLTYAKLKAAASAIRNGAQFLSSNPDPVFPNGQEVIPASGAIQAALEVSTGQKARVTGKPEPHGFRLAVERLGAMPAQTAVLGDQLETDILGAKRAGLQACLVLSSLTPSYSPQEGIVKPDAVFDSTWHFYQAWKRQRPSGRQRAESFKEVV
jgi:4-nitrophenyl phosphatase